jgi:zinc transport system substrate-binding protein
MRNEILTLENMRMSKSILFLILLPLVIILVSTAIFISCTPVEEDTGRHKVVVTILPQVEFVERVGGDKVAVKVMVPPGASLHNYEPTPSQMIGLSNAKIYAEVGSGIEFELVWMEKIAAQNKKMLIVDCSKGVSLASMNDGSIKREGETGNHRFGAEDPHIWMSPLNAKIMVRNIYEGLVRIDPKNRFFYETNRDEYLGELTEVDKGIKDALSSITNRKFAVFHPSFGYFARDYDLTMISIEENGKEPTAESIAILIEQMKKDSIKIIFASPQFSPGSAIVIANEIGGEVVFVDSMAKDYISNLKSLTNELVKAMESK